MSKMSRRSFLKSSSVAVAIPVMGTTGTVLAKENSPTNTGTTLDYPKTAVGNANQLPINKPVNFNYPDSRSPCALIRMGQAVPGGMGPDQDIVAYSILCTTWVAPLITTPSHVLSNALVISVSLIVRRPGKW